MSATPTAATTVYTLTDYANIATVIASVITILALIFLALQIRGENKISKRDGVIRLFDILDSEDSKKNRKELYLAHMEKRKLTIEESVKADMEIAKLNQVALMVREGYIDKKIAIELLSFTVVHFWIALEEYIKEQRNARCSPKWVYHLQCFYQDCKIDREKKYPDEATHFFDINKDGSVKHFVEV